MNHLNRSHGSKVMVKIVEKSWLSAIRTHGCDSHPVLSFSGYIKYPVRSAPPSAIRTRQESRLFKRQMDYSCHQSVLGCDPHPRMRFALDQMNGPELHYTTQKLECDSHSRVRLAPEPRCFWFKRGSGQISLPLLIPPFFTQFSQISFHRLRTTISYHERVLRVFEVHILRWIWRIWRLALDLKSSDDRGLPES